MIDGSYVGLVGCKGCGTVRMGCFGPCGVCKSWDMVQLVYAETIAGQDSSGKRRLVSMFTVENIAKHPEDEKNFT